MAFKGSSSTLRSRNHLKSRYDARDFVAAVRARGVTPRDARRGTRATDRDLRRRKLGGERRRRSGRGQSEALKPAPKRANSAEHATCPAPIQLTRRSRLA